VAGFSITAVPAAHEEIEHDDAGRMLHLGYVVRCGPYAIYHAGDTIPYDALASRVRAVGEIDVALLPINGRAPERRIAGNLDATEAAGLGRAIGARTVIPCHYEMFAFNTADPADFVAACHAVGQRCDVLRCGELWSTAALDTSAPRHD
jgi:L-ascorbate metabolism protein UlaG (beta-lactamase superfamily)